MSGRLKHKRALDPRWLPRAGSVAVVEIDLLHGESATVRL
jgi:hypothetical protein